MKRRKIVSLILALCICLSLLPAVTVDAAEDIEPIELEESGMMECFNSENDECCPCCHDESCLDGCCDDCCKASCEFVEENDPLQLDSIEKSDDSVGQGGKPVLTKAASSSSIKDQLTSLKNTYKPGSYWNHKSGSSYDGYSVTGTPCGTNGYVCNQLYGGLQCWAFARHLAKILFGSYPPEASAYSDGYTTSSGWKLIRNASKVTLEPGDYIRADGHSAIVWYVDGNNVYVAQCWGGSGCKLDWGAFWGSKKCATLSAITSTNFVGVWKHPGSSSGTPTQSYYLDVNGLLDGENSGNTDNYGTFDVYIDGVQKANDVTDYYIQWPTGTKYEIKDIKAIGGHVYNGVVEGSLSGTIGSSKVNIRLSFSTPSPDPASITASSYNVSLDLSGKHSQTVWITTGGNMPSRYGVRYDNSNCDYLVSCKWGEWDGPTGGRYCDLTINATGDETGTGTIKVYLLDKTNGETVIDTLYIYVTVWDSTPRISANYDDVYLDPDMNPSVVVTVTASGDLPYPYQFRYDVDFCSFVSCGWGEWDGSSNLLTITANRNGSGTVFVYLIDRTNNDAIIDTIGINVYSSYSYEYAYLNELPDSLDLKPGDSTTYWVSADTHLNNSYQFWWETSDTSVAACEWGEWENHQCPLTIRSSSEGQATVTVRIQEMDSGKVWDVRNIVVTSRSPGDTDKPGQTDKPGKTNSPGSSSTSSASLPCDGGKSCPGKVFKDMPAKGNWAHDAIDWAVEKGITNGTDKTHFSPGVGCTRAQVVTFLWRTAGSPSPTSKKNPFKDVKKGAYYYEAVLWAVENGVTKGMSATTFVPNATCTRGQIVTFLYRFKGSPKVKNGKNPFKDVSSKAFYYDAVLWAAGKGVTNGITKTTFAPKDTCTRGQIVTFLYRAK